MGQRSDGGHEWAEDAGRDAAEGAKGGTPPPLPQERRGAETLYETPEAEAKARALAVDEDAANEPPEEEAVAPVADCPLCHAGKVYPEVAEEEGGLTTSYLVCHGCGSVFADEEELQEALLLAKAYTPAGRQARAIMQQAGSDTAVPDRMSLHDVAAPAVVNSVSTVARVVDAILYYQDTAARVMAAAKALAEQSQAKADFLQGHHANEMVTVLQRATDGKGKRCIDVVCTQRKEPVRLQLRASKATIQVVEAEDCLAWLEQRAHELAATMPEGDEAKAVAAALRHVPEKVTPAETKVDRNGAKALYKAHGVVPDGCVEVFAHDTLFFK